MTQWANERATCTALGGEGRHFVGKAAGAGQVGNLGLFAEGDAVHQGFQRDTPSCSAAPCESQSALLNSCQKHGLCALGAHVLLTLKQGLNEGTNVSGVGKKIASNLFERASSVTLEGSEWLRTRMSAAFCPWRPPSG